MDEVTKSLLAYWNLHQPGGGKGLPTAGLVFWAPLDTWGARTASGHALTYRGTASTAVEPTATTYKGVKCCEFPANSYWSATTNVKAQKEAYEGTLSFWLAPKQTLTTSYPMEGVVCCRYNQNNYYYGMLKNSSPARFKLGIRNNATTASYDDTPNSTNWHHYAVTLSCAAGWTNTSWTMAAYVDGEKKKEATASVPNYQLTRAYLGNSNATNNALYIAGVRLYDRILNADEIAALASEYEPTN